MQLLKGKVSKDEECSISTDTYAKFFILSNSLLLHFFPH